MYNLFFPGIRLKAGWIFFGSTFEEIAEFTYQYTPPKLPSPSLHLGILLFPFNPSSHMALVVTVGLLQSSCVECQC